MSEETKPVEQTTENKQEETPVVAEQALEDNTTDTEGKIKTEEFLKGNKIKIGQCVS